MLRLTEGGRADSEERGKEKKTKTQQSLREQVASDSFSRFKLI